MKNTFLLCLSLATSSFLFSQDNPYAKYGFKPKVATLTNGKFIEIHDRDTIVQIGRIVYNTMSKEIVGFVELDTAYSEATLAPDIVSRWLSPDPMQHMRMWVSPYNFVQNNPIMRIDPDGRLDGDYYDKEGNHLGNDGIDDGKVYHVDGASKFNIKDFQSGGKYFGNHEGFAKNNGEGFSINQWSYTYQDSKLEEFMPTLLSHEGGFVNHPNDPGGATNKGITMNTFAKYSQSLLGVKPTVGNLGRLSDSQAGAIYEAGYWNPSGAGRISDKQIGWLYFDTFVNGGGSSVLRNTLSIYGMGSGVSSLNTLLQTTTASEIFENYKCERMCRYDNIIERRPSLDVFRGGWESRVNSFQYK